MSRNFQSSDKEEKKAKPKPTAQVTMVVRDDGKVACDFWVWEEDELGRRKKWTVSGEDAIKFLHKAQPNIIRVLASLINVQVAVAGFPKLQGPWITMQGNKMVGHIEPNEKMSPAEFDLSRSPVGNGMGEKLAAAEETRQSEVLGLPPVA